MGDFSRLSRASRAVLAGPVCCADGRQAATAPGKPDPVTVEALGDTFGDVPVDKDKKIPGEADACSSLCVVSVF